MTTRATATLSVSQAKPRQSKARQGKALACKLKTNMRIFMSI